MLVNEKTPNDYRFLHLNNIGQSQREPTPVAESHEEDDHCIKSANLLSTPNVTPQIPKQTEALLSQINIDKQINKLINNQHSKKH